MTKKMGTTFTVIQAEYGLLFTLCPQCGSSSTELRFMHFGALDDPEAPEPTWNGQMGCFDCNHLFVRTNDNLCRVSYWRDVTHDPWARRMIGKFLSGRELGAASAEVPERTA